jgi:hypothetical protein
MRFIFRAVWQAALGACVASVGYATPVTVSRTSAAASSTSHSTPVSVSPTTTPTASSISFTIQSVKVVYSNANPTKAYDQPSLPTLKVGRQIEFLLYATFHGITGPLRVKVRFRVIESGQEVSRMGAARHGPLSSNDNGRVQAFWKVYGWAQPGTYTVIGKVYVGAELQDKTVTFRVVSA